MKPALGKAFHRIARKKLICDLRLSAKPSRSTNASEKSTKQAADDAEVDKPAAGSVLTAFFRRDTLYLIEGIMAATEIVHVRVEKRIKTQAAKTLAAIGVS